MTFLAFKPLRYDASHHNQIQRYRSVQNRFFGGPLTPSISSTGYSPSLSSRDVQDRLYAPDTTAQNMVRADFCGRRQAIVAGESPIGKPPQSRPWTTELRASFTTAAIANGADPDQFDAYIVTCLRSGFTYIVHVLGT